MYNVYQHWDPLKVCIVGRSYSPAFYSFIKNGRVRTVIERIAEETEEDYQKLIKLLESFNVEVLRPDVTDNYEDFLGPGNRIEIPPMTPRDYSIMLGNKFFFKPINHLASTRANWNMMRGSDWPQHPPTNDEEFKQLPEFVKNELKRAVITDSPFDCIPFPTDSLEHLMWKNVIDKIKPHADVFTHVPAGYERFNSAMITRIGKDVYLGTQSPRENMTEYISNIKKYDSTYRWHVVDTQGHSDGTFCPVVPGLIVSLRDIPTYRETFPDWEVVYLPGQSWNSVTPFLNLKQKNKGKWWVPGEELNDDFTNFVETWLNHWVGYVEETVFDVNMLVIDEKNVVCNNYNEKVFKAFERYGITPHIINFRHRYFWDGGLHCITSDVHREGTMKDYFPERG